ncbi:MAG: YfbK domain-containing protein [Chthoniobacterales bacterium]
MPPWLFCVCRNCALDQQRKIVHFREEPDENENKKSDSPTPSEQAATKDESRQLRKLICLLPEKQRELLTVKLRYKEPDGDTSKLLEFPLAAEPVSEFAKTSENFQFASAVAAFGMKLRGSPFAGEISWNEIQNIVRENLAKDPGNYRAAIPAARFFNSLDCGDMSPLWEEGDMSPQGKRRHAATHQMKFFFDIAKTVTDS